MHKKLLKPSSDCSPFNWTAIIIIITLLFSTPAAAKGLDLASGSKDMPIEITADHGIEWKKDKEILVASGNAKASRDGINVIAEVLRAYYRKKVGGGTDLYRLEAVGGVKIFSDTDSITGESAVLDFEQAIFTFNYKGWDTSKILLMNRSAGRME